MKEETVFLTTTDAAIKLKCGTSTLEKLRVFGGGPRFVKFGRSVRYRLSDLDIWIESKVVGSTSEADELPKPKIPQYKTSRIDLIKATVKRRTCSAPASGAEG